MEKIIQMGMQFGLEGEKLLEFVEMQQKLQEGKEEKRRILEEKNKEKKGVRERMKREKRDLSSVGCGNWKGKLIFGDTKRLWRPLKENTDAALRKHLRFHRS